MSRDPAKAGADLRRLLLEAKPADFHLAPTPELPNVWAAMMEMRVNKARVSIVAVAEGSTSMYFDPGGAVIGGGEHASVRDANRKFLALVEQFFAARAFVARDAPLDTPNGAVAFAVFTYSGFAVARDTEERLKSKKSPIWPLFFMGHEVIAALREVNEKQGGG